MTRPSKHARTLAFPYADSLLNARLDALHEESHGKRRDVIMDYHELSLLAQPKMLNEDGRLAEQVQGHYVPRRVRFVGVRELKRTGFYTHLEDVPLDHGARSLRGMLHWRTPEGETLYLLINGSDEPAELMLSARRCVGEDRPGPEEPALIVRDWSPTPSFSTRLVPVPRHLHRRFGGDPITIRLGDRLCHRRLFVGGLDCQGDQRPNVDAVLNLSESPSRWVSPDRPYTGDRWVNKGEGKQGMAVGEMIEEAQWVIERLRAGQRVLVHCVAGFNRSVTISCAVLILLEGLSAEAALARVREHHPWARPDSHHWLALRWLAHTAAAPHRYADAFQPPPDRA